MSAEKYVLAIDEGTSSARSILFDHDGHEIAVSQKSIEQEFPQPGWVEQDPVAIWNAVAFTIDDVLKKTGIAKEQLAAIGVANQRETAILWDRKTGKPVYNAITWQDVREDMNDIVNEVTGEAGPDRFHAVTGLKLSPVWSAVKIRWILDHVPGLRERAASGDICFGNPDSWVVWNLTGGTNGGVHITDVTNASRTSLMDVRKLDWHPEACQAFGIPVQMLPEIRSSVEVYGVAKYPESIAGVEVAAVLGDQQAATFGQACVKSGMAKCSYGTSSPVLMNTGDSPVFSGCGLATCLAYQIKGQAPQYLLENQILVSGSLLQWVRDKVKLVDSVQEIDELAESVPDNGDVYFVPAFSGLWAPYWHTDARGTIVGLTQFHSRAHLARAALEATAWQIKDAFEVMQKEANVKLTELRVDGGMVKSNFLMQFQADVLGVDVVAPVNTEATSWGAAFAAGLAVGFWNDVEQLVDIWQEDKRWKPSMPQEEVEAEYEQWQKAVTKSFGWLRKKK
ncbi:MAG: glycerol kinase GlpK [Ancrocorticia sp.]|jgi:glycerol kinase|nr:glycerol kinase GlpK [Ancrocorticia sp.]MCI1964430.1 glycerol kinase GlpK [Ancrocorticia sp.]MCI2002241.1 glycerol kinase GlpK [Ancrocorticia sp.]MCI2179241.1 glycerol kinase GlpK [Ancrocorticia sp.]MCI2194381.1 glycerol kinase GlpK [Ancrocorticia sp.]